MAREERMIDRIQSRSWCLGSHEDDGSLHALGNGRLLAYGRGPDLVKLWGPHYTSPDLASLSLSGPAGLRSVSSREGNAPIWHHALQISETEVGEIIDVVDRDLPFLVRRIVTSVPLMFRLRQPHALPGICPSCRWPGTQSLISIVPPGTLEYGRRFFSVLPRTVHAVVRGAACILPEPDGEDCWTVLCEAGESQILLVCGEEYPDSLQVAEAALATDWDAVASQTRQHWAGLLGNLRIPAIAGPLREPIATAAEDVALAILTQQAAGGAVVAGHNYCLGYVRDQYGVSRALLALGLHRQARSILAFYWGIFQREGVIHNAQTIGPHTRFHVHENDEVEITGWIPVQAFDYLSATGDDAFVQELAPMLAWCVDAQERHLVDGMLPFNGDETYVAGGMVPREALDDGAAEATLLYVAGARRFAAWCAQHGYGRSEDAERRLRNVAETAARYRANFFVGPRLMVNNPSRLAHLVRARFRHGVCHARLAGCRGLDWLELASDGRYACPVCFPQWSAKPRTVAPRYFLPSVAALPAFIDHAIAAADEEGAMLEAALVPFVAAEGGFRWPPERLPGYELGMLLHALAHRRDPRCEAVARVLLDLREATGVWCEYYSNGCGSNTRYRPWESAIKLCGLLHAADAGLV